MTLALFFEDEWGEINLFVGDKLFESSPDTTKFDKIELLETKETDSPIKFPKIFFQEKC